jgi:hypothetical protein
MRNNLVTLRVYEVKEDRSWYMKGPALGKKRRQRRWHHDFQELGEDFKDFTEEELEELEKFRDYMSPREIARENAADFRAARDPSIRPNLWWF